MDSCFDISKLVATLFDSLCNVLVTLNSGFSVKNMFKKGTLKFKFYKVKQNHYFSFHVKGKYSFSNKSIKAMALY